MEYDLENMTLIDLVKAYGDECLVGADCQGYLSRWPNRLLAEIKNRIELVKQDGGHH